MILPLASSSPSISLSNAPMRLLQSSWSLSQEDESLIDPQMTKLHHAASKGNIDKLTKHMKKTEINVVDSFGRTALHLTAGGGHTRAVGLLLSSGANAGIQDKKGMTALSRAVETGHLEIVQQLLEAGASTDVPDTNGETCVHMAVRARTTSVLSLLVRRGANPDIINYDGQSALHLAVSNTDIDCVNVLLRAGALVNIRYQCITRIWK